eukprot:10744835-Lingulodinium_polyedra.AAC.1
MPVMSAICAEAVNQASAACLEAADCQPSESKGRCVNADMSTILSSESRPDDVAARVVVYLRI